jgi:hypothetical protein
MYLLDLIFHIGFEHDCPQLIDDLQSVAIHSGIITGMDEQVVFGRIWIDL